MDAQHTSALRVIILVILVTKPFEGRFCDLVPQHYRTRSLDFQGLRL